MKCDEKVFAIANFVIVNFVIIILLNIVMIMIMIIHKIIQSMILIVIANTTKLIYRYEESLRTTSPSQEEILSSPTLTRGLHCHHHHHPIHHIHQHHH